MAKKKKKKKGISLSNKRSSSMLAYQKLVFGMDDAPDELFKQVVNEIRINAKSETQALYVYKDLLLIEPYKKAAKGIFLKQGLDIENDTLNFNAGSTIDDNLCWIATNLELFHEELNIFILKKNKVERFILKGEFDLALDELKQLVAACGESIWSVSTYFTCLFFLDQDDKLLEFRNNLPSDISELSKICILYEYATSRASSTYQNYLSSLSRQCEDLRIEGLNAYEDLIKFKYDFDPTVLYKDYRIIISGFSYSRLCDLYLFLLRSLRYCLIHNIEIPRTYKLFSTINNDLNDPQLNLILSKFGQNHDLIRPDKENLISWSIIEVHDAYLAENYDKVIELANELLAQSPETSIIYEIVAKSIDSSSVKLVCYGPVMEIINSVRNLYNKNEVESNTKKLSKLFLNLKQFDWAFHLKAQIHKYGISHKGKVSDQYNFADSTQTILNPFDLDNINNYADSIDNIGKLLEGYVDFVAIHEFLDVNLRNLDKRNILSEWRFYKSKADYAFNKKQFANAIENYQKLLSIESENYCKIEVKAKLIESHYLNQNFNHAIDQLAEALVSGFEPSLFPIQDIAKYIIQNIQRNDDLKLLESCSIVLYFYNSFFNEDVTQELSNILENLFKSSGHDVVEDVSLTNWDFSPYILTHILTIDVMDGFIRLFDDDVDIYTARLKICKTLLSDIGDENSSLYKHVLNEHNSSFNRMVLYFCTSEGIDGRINIDKDSLKVLLLDELADDFIQLEHLEYSDDFKIIGLADENNSGTVVGNPLVLKLTDILARIFNEYTVNKLYGLDNSLNVGLRHGELVNHMWGPLKLNKIAGVKGDDGIFNVDLTFDDYKLYQPEVLTEIKTKYANFLAEFNKAVLKFRNLCHVDAGEQVTDEERLFNYTIPDSFFNYFVEQYNKGLSLEQLIDEVFYFLDKETDEKLIHIRECEFNKFESNLMNKFIELKNNLKPLPRNFSQKFNLSTTQCGERLTALRTWFDWAGEPNTPFVLGAANLKARELVASLYPSSSINYELTDDSIPLIKSKYFTSFVTLFSLVQENALKHCGLEDSIFITEKFSSIEGDFFIEYTNNIHKSKLDELQRKVANINENLAGNIVERAARDSGSGIYKIKSILDNRIKVENTMNISVKNNLFTVTINIIDRGKIEYENSVS